MPRVSVLMPVWNAGPFLKPAVASILSQEERDLELLAVDDGSTDGSGEVLRRLAGADHRLRVVEHACGNEGIANARNRLLAAARTSASPFVAFLNHDDLASPGRLRLQLGVLDDRPEISLLGAQHRLIDGDDRPLLEASRWPTGDLEIRWFGLLDCPMRLSTVTLRASLLAALEPPGFDPAYAVFSDYDFLSRALDAARRLGTAVHTLPELLGAYRRHPGCASVRKAGMIVANGSRIAAAAIARELHGHPVAPEEIANVRAVLFNSRPPGWRASLSGHQHAIEVYLDLFDAFRARHRDHPDLAHLRADAAASVHGPRGETAIQPPVTPAGKR